MMCQGAKARLQKVFTAANRQAPGILQKIDGAGHALGRLLLALALLLSSAALHAQVCGIPGGAGPGSISGIINSYYPSPTTNTASSGSTSIAVGTIDARGSATPIAAGDLLLIVQMQDADITISNTSSYGGGAGSGFTSINSAGLYEYAVATGPVSGGSIPLAAPLVNTYRSAAASGASGQRTYQVLRVPEYSSATITGTVLAPPWNGGTGGVVAVEATGQLTWGGAPSIDVSGRGFRGGGAQRSTSNGTGTALATTDYVSRIGTGTINLAGAGSVPNGVKGEGIAGSPALVFVPTTINNNTAGTVTNLCGGLTDGTSCGYPGGSFARGAPGNAGGGGTDGDPVGNQQNTGGGGGANYSQGGLGGFGWTPLTPPGSQSGGLGGAPVPVNAARVVMGGGGGAGSSNDGTGTPANGASSSGSAGGGIVFVRAGSVSGAGTINANGTAAANTSTLNDASGGGGAGGSVVLLINNGTGATNATVNANGGVGGSNAGSPPANNCPHGPGGGGSGGFVLASGSATVNVNGGANGTTCTNPFTGTNYGSDSSPGGFQAVNLTPSQIPGTSSNNQCRPKITVTKTTSTPTSTAGGTATYTIVASNASGFGTATGLSISDVLPNNPNITYASTSSITLAGGATRTVTTNPTAAATTPVWGSFTVPGGGSISITFVVNIGAAVPLGTYQNPATVSYDDPTRTAGGQTVTPGGVYAGGGVVPGSNYASASSNLEDVTVVAAPTITKAFSPTSVAAGGVATLTLTLNNPSTISLTGIAFTDTYPAGLNNAPTPAISSTCGGSVTGVPGGSSLALSGGALAAGTSCTISIAVTGTSSSPYVNTIPVGALTTTQGVSNRSAASATLYGRATVVKSFNPTAVNVGANSTLSIAISNPNGIALTFANPALTDTFPNNLVATGGTITGSGCGAFAPTTIAANATAISFTAGSIAANSTCILSFAVKSSVVGPYANTTGGFTAVEIPNAGAPSNTAILGVGLINIAKAFAPATIVSGANSTLSFTLSNPTGVAQLGGAFTDTLSNMTVSGAQTVGGSCGVVTGGTLVNGQTALSFSNIVIPTAGCTITLVVTSNVVGTNPNTSSGVSTTLLPAGPVSNTANLIVVTKPTIAKAFSPSSMQTGGVSTMTLTITNPNTTTLTGLNFTDNFPANLVNATPLITGGTCNSVTLSGTTVAGGAVFNVTAATIPPSTTCTITAQVTSSVAAAYSNTTSGVASTETGAAGTVSNTAVLSVFGAPTITKAFGTSPIAQGGTSLITFTLTNPNTAALTGLNFTDALVNMSVASNTIGGTCVGTTHAPALTVGETSLNFTVPSLAASTSCTVTVTVTSSTQGTNPNTTSGVSSAQTPVAGTPSTTANLVVLRSPNVAVGFSPSSIQAGGTSTKTFTLTNLNGSTALTNVTFTDTLVNTFLSSATAGGTCTGVTFVPALAVNGTQINPTVASLAAGTSCTITVQVSSNTSSPPGGHINAPAGPTSAQTSAGGAVSSAGLMVYASPVLSKVFSPSAVAVSTTNASTLTITVTNPNVNALNNIAFTDALSVASPLTATAQTFGGTCTGYVPTSIVATATNLSFAGLNLAGNSSCTITIKITTGATAANNNNTTSGATSTQTPTAGSVSNTTSLAVGRANVTKSFSAAAIQVGATNTVTFAFLNAGGALTNLQWTDTWAASSPGVTVASPTGFTQSAGCTGGGWPAPVVGATSYTYAGAGANLAANTTCTISFNVSASSSGVKSNTISGSAPAAFAPATSTASFTAYATPTIAKSFAPAAIRVGGTSTLTFTLTNPNNFVGGNLSNAAFSDTLTNMSVAGAQTVGGTCTGITPASLANGATALSFTGITIPANGSCTVTVVVTSSTVGTLPNTASGITTTQTPTVGANSGAVNLIVSQVALTKAYGTAAIATGASSTLTFTLTNGTGNPAQSGISFTDTLAAGSGITITGVSALIGSGCSAGTPTFNASNPATVTLTGAAITAGNASCTFTATVRGDSAGTYANTASSISGASASVNASAVNSPLAVYAPPTLSKSFAAGSIASGATTTLTFTITNPASNPANVSGINFNDVLPTSPGAMTVANATVTNTCAGATWQGRTGAGAFAAPAAGNTELQLSGLSLPPGSSCTVSATVTSSTAGNYANTSTAIAATGPTVLTGTTASANLTVLSPPTVAKSFVASNLASGGNTNLTVTIGNTNASALILSSLFTDTFPAGMTIGAAGNSGTCTGVTATAGASSFTIANGSSVPAGGCTVIVNVTSNTAGAATNTIAANALQTNGGNNPSAASATVNIYAPPTLSKSFAAGSIASGASTTLNLILANPAANVAAITGVQVDDTFPAGLTLLNTSFTFTPGGCGTVTKTSGAASASGDNNVRFAAASINPGASCQAQINVTSSTVGAITNTTAVPLAGGPVALTGVAASATLNVLAAPTVSKSFTAAYVPIGGSTGLLITITNPVGNTAAVTGVAFTDTYPAGMTGALTATIGGGGCTGTLTAIAGSLALSGGSIPVNTTCTYSVTATGNTVGAKLNSTGAVTASNAPTGSAASATLTVLTAPTISKAFGASGVALNGSTSLAITVSNPNTTTALTGINFTDPLPSGLTAVNGTTATCGGSLVVSGGNLLTFTGGTLAASAVCVISVNVTGTTAGVKTNTTTAVGANGPISLIGSTSNTANLTVSAPPTISKSFAAATVALGGSVNMSFLIANANTTALSGIAVADTLPVGLSATNGTTATCGGSLVISGGNSLSFSGGTLAGSANCTITVPVTGTAVGAQNNTTGSISSTESGAGATSNTATVNVLAAPTVTKSFVSSNVAIGGNTTLNITVANPASNTVALTGVAFTDSYPAGMTGALSGSISGAGCTGTLTAVAGSLTLSGGTVPVNTTCTYSVTVTGTTVGAKLNTTGAVSSTNAPSSAAASATLNVYAAPTITKTFTPATIASGGTSSLTIIVTNPAGNPGNLTGVSVNDPYTGTLSNNAAGSVVCSGGGSATLSGGANGGTSVGFTAGTIVPGGTCTITQNVTATSTNTNGTTAPAATGPVALTGTAATGVLLTVSSRPTIAKSFAASTVALGGSVNMSFLITNPNPTALTGLSFSDTFPAGLSATNGTSSTCGGTLTVSGGNSLTFSGGSLAPSANCTITVLVTGTATGAQNNTTGIISSTESGAGATSNTATITVLAAPTIAKAFAVPDIALNASTTLNLTIANANTGTALSGVAFTDSLPAGLTAVNGSSVICGGNLVVTGNNLLTFTGGTLAASSNCVIGVTVTGTTSGSKSNTTGAVSASGPIALSGVASNTATLNVYAPPTISKAFGAAGIPLNGSTTLAITISNANTLMAIGGISFTDPLPSGLTAVNGTTPICGGSLVVSGSNLLTFTGGTVAASASCVISVTVSGASAGIKANTTTAVNATSPIALAGATSNTANLTVYAPPTVAKSFAAATVALGGNVNLSFLITNPNTTGLSGIAVSDTLPAGLSASNGTTAICGGSLVISGGKTLAFSGGMLAGSASCTITVPVSGTVPGAQNNTTGVISATESGAGAASNTATVNVAAVPTITKSFATPTVLLGSNVNMSFLITNPNTTALSGIAVSDTLPVGLSAANGTTATCGGSLVITGNNLLSFSGGTLAVGASCTITVAVTGISAGVQNNTTGALSSTESGIGSPSNTATITVLAAPTLAKAFSPSTISSGGVSTLTVTISNPNSSAISITSLTDTFPVAPGTGMVRAATPNLTTSCTTGTVSSTAGSVSLSGGTVPANGSCTLQIDVTAAISGSYVNTIAAGALSSSAGSNASAATATLTLTPVANVSVTKSGPATIAWGTTITYTATVSNAGPDAANGTVFSDAVAAAITAVTASCGAATGGANCGAVSVSSNTVSSTITSLPAGASVTFTIQGTAPQTGTLSNSATAIVPSGISDPDDPSRSGAGNNTSAPVSTQVQAPDLRLVKVAVGSFTVGSNGTFTLTASNSGNAASAGVITVVDTLPNGLSYVASGSGGTGWACSNSGQVVTCASSDIIAPSSNGNPITINVAVASNAVPSVTNVATVAGGNEPAFNTGNNSAVLAVSVANAGINTFNTDGVQTGLPGTTLFYAHTFKAGVSGSVSFSTTDTPVPAIAGWGVAIFRDTNCSAALDGTEGNAPFSGSIAVVPGDQVCIIIKSTIPSTAAFNSQDTIAVAANFTPSSGATSTLLRQDVTTVGPLSGAGLTLAKSVRNLTQGGAYGTSNSAKPGDTLEYMIVYTNTTNGAISTIVISDAVPAFTGYVSGACTTPLPAVLTGCAVTTAPAVGAAGNIQWTLSGPLNPNTSGSVLFRVSVQ